jgi:hypothetical protein
VNPRPNYDYSGIGKAEALLIFSALASSKLVFLTNGVFGKFTFQILWAACSWLATKEILLVNVVATDLQTLAQKGEFDGTFDDAFKKIHGQREKLSAEEKAAIDAPVRTAFRKFAYFGQLRDR